MSQVNAGQLVTSFSDFVRFVADGQIQQVIQDEKKHISELKRICVSNLKKGDILVKHILPSPKIDNGHYVIITGQNMFRGLYKLGSPVSVHATVYLGAIEGMPGNHFVAHATMGGVTVINLPEVKDTEQCAYRCFRYQDETYAELVAVIAEGYVAQRRWNQKKPDGKTEKFGDYSTPQALWSSLPATWHGFLSDRFNISVPPASEMSSNWGANAPTEFFCSDFVVQCLKAASETREEQGAVHHPINIDPKKVTPMSLEDSLIKGCNSNGEWEDLGVLEVPIPQ